MEGPGKWSAPGLALALGGPGERAWSLSRCRTTETVTLSRVALGGRISAVYDQRYKCHNLRDDGRRPPATKFTTPRLLQRQQQAYRLRSAISAYPTCIRRPIGILLCMFIGFDTTHERDRQTDRHTHTHTHTYVYYYTLRGPRFL